MVKRTIHPLIVLAAGILGTWFLIRYALPVLFPFLLGTGIALAAEPLAGFLGKRLGLKRWLAAAIGVSGVFTGLLCLLVLALALLFRQAGQLTAVVPQVADGVRVGMDALEGWLLSAASSAPEGIRRVVTGGVTGFFSDGSAIVQRITDTLPGLLSKVFTHVAGGVVTFATAVLAAFMICIRLPQLRRWLGEHLPDSWKQQYLPALKTLRRSLAGWITAQLKLTLVIGGILLACFWLLRIPHGILWAAVIAMVDAMPVLGCGIALVPWSMICLLQGNRLVGIGLLATYGLVFLVRSVLEPRLLGKELGLDPLVTLIAIYTGYRLLGLPGMLLAPLCAVAITRWVKNPTKNADIP